MSTSGNSQRLIIVTGKGGVGKSLLAAAVARVSAAQGLATVLVTLDTRDERHPILDVPLTYEPRTTPYGFSVSRVDAFAAAREYASRNLPFGAMYGAFFSSRTFRDFAAAAPGFEELMCLGKLYHLATESAFRRVVFDAPATGHLRSLLGVPGTVQRAVRVGPLNHNARRIEDLLLDPDRTRVLIATLAEEMPVSEAAETLALTRDQMRMGAGTVLVNQRVWRRFAESECRGLEELRADGTLSPAVEAAVTAALDEVASAQSQQAALVPLRRAHATLVQIPRIVQRHHDASRLLQPAAAFVAEALGAPAPEGADDPAPIPKHARGGEPCGAGPVRRTPPAGSTLDLGALVRTQRVIVCCGSGGVGKTTTAAALGLLAARAGLRAQVMTIDPARRLAQAMGLDALGHEPRRVAVDAPGELSAMMLDTKRAFDRLIERHAPDDRVREAIFANQYYQQLSASLGGSRELVAMERVLEAAAAGDHDLLIVDTPPSQHALDFLDAPQRMINLLDGSMTQWLVRPYGVAARAQFEWFRQSSAMGLKFMERFTGVQMLADLSDFLLAFSGMFDGFRERSHRVQALMRDPGTAFLLVCSPEPSSLAQVDQFAARLERDAMPVAGVLANRVAPPPGGAPDPDEGDRPLLIPNADLVRLAGAGDPAFSDTPLPDRLTRAWRDAVDLYLADREALATLQNDRLPLHTVPRVHRDVQSMADLERFADLLVKTQPADSGTA